MKFFKKYLPNHQSIRRHEHLKWIKHWIADPQLWHFNRRSVAKGTAVGLFVAIIPLPLQMLLAAIMAIIFRCNLPIAVVMTWVTNPITMVPVIYLIYKVGAFITKDVSQAQSTFQQLRLEVQDPVLFWQHFQFWLTSLGKNFFIGLPVVAVGAALVGYLFIHAIWRISIYCQLYLRNKRKK
jgi:uncharacterized protein